MAMVRLPSGTTVNYREWGRPDGAVVLMLHGLTSTGYSWRNVGTALGDRFRVIAPDARGHGESDWAEDYSFEAMRGDVVGLMERLGIYGALVVGHSMGALTAYELAASRPDLVRLLVLEEIPAPVPAHPPRRVPRGPHWLGRWDWRAEASVNRWRNAPPRQWWELADRITATTMVIGGTQSHLDQAAMRTLAERIPHGEFVALDGGHDLHTRRPSDFLIKVEPFMAYFAK